MRIVLLALTIAFTASPAAAEQSSVAGTDADRVVTAW
jgi:hypothetical protein